MAAAAFKLFILAVNGRAVESTKDMEAIYKTLSVSADGNDNGLTISESSGKFDFNAKKLGNIGAATASGQAVEFAQLNTALGLYVPLTQKGAANGVATLDAGGRLPSSQVPPLAVTSTSVVASQAAQLALTTQEGDVVVRTDESKTYIRNAGVVGDMTDFTEIVTPGTGVQSVNGQAGPNVVLTTSDIAEGSNLYYTTARFDARFATAFATAFAAESTTDLAEGSNLYFTSARAVTAVVVQTLTGGDTGHAPSADAVATALAGKQDVSDLYRTLQNAEGGAAAHTARKVVYLSAFGQAKLAKADTAGLSEKTIFAMTRDASIADTASGTYWLPKQGTVVSGFSGLTFDTPVYVSKTAAGGFQTTEPVASGDAVIRIGYAISATEIIFDPSYEYQVA